jgi:hypothetical protein
MRPFYLGAVCALSMAFWLGACGGDDGGSGGAAGSSSSTTSTGTGGAGGGGEGGAGGQGGSQVVLGDIDVTVQYAGAQTGTLSIAAFKQFPPAGPPLAFSQDKMPKFPAMATLKGLEPGDYYVVAILDIGNNNPQMPGPEDLQTVTMPAVTVKGNDMPAVTLTLMDKP